MLTSVGVKCLLSCDIYILALMPSLELQNMHLVIAKTKKDAHTLALL